MRTTLDLAQAEILRHRHREIRDRIERYNRELRQLQAKPRSPALLLIEAPYDPS